MRFEVVTHFKLRHPACIQFEFKIEDGVLCIRRSQRSCPEDEHTSKVSNLDIARPGESARIYSGLEMLLEPRVKVGGRGGIFPGVISKATQLGGEERLHALKGMAVVTGLVKLSDSKKVSRYDRSGS